MAEIKTPGSADTQLVGTPPGNVGAAVTTIAGTTPVKSENLSSADQSSVFGDGSSQRPLSSSGGGGGIGGGGTVNTIARFTPDGTHVGDSQITDDGTDISMTASNVYGAANGGDGFYFSGTGLANFFGVAENVVGLSGDAGASLVADTGDATVQSSSGISQLIGGKDAGKAVWVRAYGAAGDVNVDATGTLSMISADTAYLASGADVHLEGTAGVLVESPVDVVINATRDVRIISQGNTEDGLYMTAQFGTLETLGGGFTINCTGGNVSLVSPDQGVALAAPNAAGSGIQMTSGSAITLVADDSVSSGIVNLFARNAITIHATVGGGDIDINAESGDTDIAALNAIDITAQLGRLTLGTSGGVGSGVLVGQNNADLVGFFGTAPILRPTGIAVDLTALYNAIASLGLISP